MSGLMKMVIWAQFMELNGENGKTLKEWKLTKLSKPLI
jgi:hypothetical protein